MCLSTNNLTLITHNERLPGDVCDAQADGDGKDDKLNEV